VLVSDELQQRASMIKWQHAAHEVDDATSHALQVVQDRLHEVPSSSLHAMESEQAKEKADEAQDWRALICRLFAPLKPPTTQPPKKTQRLEGDLKGQRDSQLLQRTKLGSI
jgi:hypothetical protein